MKVAIITFPGSNCDDDCLYVFKELLRWDAKLIWHESQESLNAYQLVVLPGGFSYGDYLRSGAIASISPIMKNVAEFSEKGGHVLGVCNGFQMLCELGLLPGALARNEKLQFICKDVTLKIMTSSSPWTCEFSKGELVRLPIAHAEGRYILSEEEYQKMLTSGQILLTYTGHETDSNPNGSCFAIAGVTNERKNVFGLMPHLERASDLRSHDGMKFWKSLERTLKEQWLTT